jgi:hypothetical protein
MVTGKQFFFFMFGFAQIVDCQYLGLNILHYCKPEVFYKTWRIKNHFAFSVRAEKTKKGISSVLQQKDLL